MEGAVRPSAYQRLVDRWVDITAWPTAKKTVLAMAIAAVFHTFIGVVAIAALTLSPGVVDLPLFVRAYGAWAATTVICMLLAMPSALRGREGRWTVYAVVAIYGGGVCLVVALLGVAITPWVAIAPLAVLLVPIYWDLAAGRFAFVVLVFWLTVVSFLELTDRIPLAPLLLQRTFEAQRSVGWHFATHFAILCVLAYVFLLVHFSVSARETQQRRLEARRRELEAVSRRKSEFLASMSHELRTPLNAVIGFSEVLQARMFGPLNDKQAEYVEDILHSGRHLLSLINDILDLAKIEAGRTELEPSTFDLTAAIENALVLTKERVVRRGLRLERRLDAHLGAVWGDERKVKQVLINLLTNAVKFTPEGGTISVIATRGPDAVTLSVEDTGIGIAPENQEIVFEEFRQLGDAWTRKQEGTGLGLALARRFVAMHGGRLWVDSELGRGSAFRFTLPLGQPDAKAVEAGEWILAVDDDAARRRRPRQVEPKPQAAYQRLVDRWVDLTAWPTAKKTVLTMAIAAVFHTVLGLTFILALALFPGVIDLDRFVPAYGLWVGTTIVLFLLALPSAWRGREGRWTVYGVVVLYGGCLLWFMTLLGVPNTPLYALVPLVVLLVAIFWDLAAGRFAFAFMLVGLVFISFLELTGRIPLAPLMLHRTIEGQRNLGWHVVVHTGITSILLYVFSLVHFSVSVRDSQRQRLEASRRELEAVSRHKSEFLANMSHELRTPLNAVIGFSEVLQARMFGPLNAKQAEYAEDILQSGRHLLSLINDILDLAKIEAGRTELEPSTFDLAATIENALVLTKERVVRRGLRLERRLDPHLGAVWADERKVKQVLVNLLTNAVKFTPEGGTITVVATRSPEAVTLSVEDTGIGIAPENQELIFEEFRQVGDAWTGKQEGTGLGLALARRFVALHGGRLWVDSALGRGSAFRFTLPVEHPAALSVAAGGT
jgi:signal transduction histidine kinase